MPKLPRDLSHDRLVRFLKKKGWTVAREGRKHSILVKAGAEFSVPRHTKLVTSTVSAILKQAGITTAQWSEI